MTKDRFSGPGRSPFNISSAMKWKNTSDEAVPAYGVVKLDSYDVAGDFFNAIKPDGEGDLHFVNGPVAVAVNAYGGSQLWNHSRIGKTSSTTFGAIVGPVAGSWEMNEEGEGFVVFSTPADGVAAILQIGDGGRPQHGIVTANLGCGYYTIEKATWSGSQDTAGSGLGSGSGADDCDICFDVTGEGTSACAITLTIPPLQVTGTGVFVTAYDSASGLIPLIVGTSCLITNLGDTNDTASGSGADEKIWQVVRGMQNHVVEYKEEWDCCDGAGESGIETLISKTPIILIGKECDAISCGTCDTASGSG